MPRCTIGISRLDDLLGNGIPRGSSLLIAGVAGTGKTVLLLEFVHRGAQAGEKGIIFSFEETEEGSAQRREVSAGTWIVKLKRAWSRWFLFLSRTYLWRETS